MNNYIELTLLPGAEIPLYFLWEKLYQQVHLALVEAQNHDRRVAVGVAFPEYDTKRCQLGTKLRLFASTRHELEHLDLTKWLSRLLDYVHITSIRDVPDECTFTTFKRLQPKSSNDRMARRKAKRQGISFDQAMEQIGSRKEKTSKAPFIHMVSLSSRKSGSTKRYRLIICQQETPTSRSGHFSTYGLSGTTTVPVF